MAWIVPPWTPTSGSSSQTWWPQTSTGATYPTWGEFQTKTGIPQGEDYLKTTGYSSILQDPLYGRVSEEEINRLYDIVAQQNLQTGMEDISSRFANAGYAPQFSAPEFQGRLRQGLEGERANLLYQNLQKGTTAKTNLYQQALGAAGQQQTGLMSAYTQAMLRGIGPQDKTSQGVNVQQPGTAGMGGYNQATKSNLYEDPFAGWDTVPGALRKTEPAPYTPDPMPTKGSVGGGGYGAISRPTGYDRPFEEGY